MAKSPDAAAAKATRAMTPRRGSGSARATVASSTVGMGGNSVALMPFMLAWALPDFIWGRRESGSMSMRLPPRELTKLVSARG